MINDPMLLAIQYRSVFADQNGQAVLKDLQNLLQGAEPLDPQDGKSHVQLAVRASLMDVWNYINTLANGE
jgi:hypothetical protein